MKLEVIWNIVYAVAGGITTAIPFIIGLVKNVKAKKIAKTQKEEAEAECAIKDEIKNLVRGAEETFSTIDKILKGQGSSAGTMKKAEVMKSLKVFCLENGYHWNEDDMSFAVEREVEYTKQVNSTQKNEIE